MAKSILEAHEVHTYRQAFRQGLTHVVGSKQEVRGEDEEHEVDDSVQQQ